MSSKEEKNQNYSISNDLFKFKLLIGTKWKKNIANLDVIDRAIEQCKRNKQSNEWEYSFEKLIFRNINLGRKVRPLEIKVSNESTKRNYDISLSLTIKIKGTHINEHLIKDSLLKLNVNFDIEGKFKDKEEKTQNVKSAWHLDKNEGDEAPNFMHPEYHFHFGGHFLTKDETLNFGNILILESPRIPHPPLDAILAMDFIIHHFYTTNEHKILTQDKQYKEIVFRSQHRFWRCYAMAQAIHWGFELPTEYEVDKNFIKKIYPNILF